MFSSKVGRLSSEDGRSRGWLLGVASVALVVGYVALPAVAVDSESAPSPTPEAAVGEQLTEQTADTPAPDPEAAVADQPTEQTADTPAPDPEAAVADQPTEQTADTPAPDPEAAVADQPTEQTADTPAPDPEAAVSDVVPPPTSEGAEAPPAGQEPLAPPTAPGVDPAATGDPSVTTDASNYSPGDTATVTGSGWSPGESITLSLLDLDWKTTVTVRSITVDESGGFVESMTLPDFHIVDLNITATGASGQVVHGFSALIGSS